MSKSQWYETTLNDSDDSDGVSPWGSGVPRNCPVSLSSVSAVSQQCHSSVTAALEGWEATPLYS